MFRYPKKYRCQRYGRSNMSMLVVLTLVLITPTIANEEAPTIITPSGRIKGFYQRSQSNRKFQSYEGIPYAQPPVGELRFEPPQSLHESWDGELNATQPGPECLQYWIPIYDLAMGVTGTEDCLYLNVYTPDEDVKSKSDEQLLPVIFFIHGGSYLYGSGADQGQPDYIMNKDVVLVTMNYRLGPLGFLSTEDSVVPGNMGLKDQTLALQWVAENIESFGGDPNSVTLFGQSAGGSSVHFHYLSPMSRGLFHRGVSLSGTALNCWAQTEASLEKAQKLGTLMGCATSSNEELVTCLKNVSAEKIMGAVPEFMGWLYNPDVPFGPVAEKDSDTSFMDKSPVEIINSGEAADLPWVTTVVSEEGLYTGAQFVADKKLTKQLDDNWESIAPHLLDYNYTIPIWEHANVAWKIRKHYLKNRPIDRRTIKKVMHMMGDRLYAADAEKTVRIQAEVSTNPIRLYYFSYRGEYSLSEDFTGTNKNYGVSHADDEFYVFPGPKGRVKSKRDRMMVDYMVNLWTSFAATGIPDAGVDWVAVDPRQEAIEYLHIAGPNKRRIESNENFGEKNFWNTIDFDENKMDCDFISESD